MSPSSNCPKRSGTGMPNISSMSCLGFFRSAPHEGAAALGDRAERLLGRGGGHDLEVVPRPARLVRRFHLEQVGGVYLAPVLAHPALPEGVVVGGHRLHA